MRSSTLCLTLCIFTILAGSAHCLAKEVDWAEDVDPSIANLTSTTTTTISPETTTIFPTTTSTPLPTTYSTTIEPSTSTTTIQPTTTPGPHPPNPSTGTWSVTDDSNITCIVVKLSAAFIIPYNTTNGQMRNATVILPANATSSGDCYSAAQRIVLSWTSGVEFLPYVNNLTLVFHRNESRLNTSSVDQISLSDITLNVYMDERNFPNSSEAGQLVYGERLDASLHPVKVNSSYRCTTEENIKLNSEPWPILSKFSHVQMEAFRSQSNEKFNTAVDCAADGILTSDVVPIAVGCALAALVVIVLIAYLIGRRRARQRGYQSV